MNRPNIFDYLHYRQYLRDMYRYHKSTAPGRFSFRIFAKRARMSSPNYLKMVMDGDRELSQATIFKFGRALKMKKNEVQFLEVLVFYCKSKSEEEKEYYIEKMKKFKKFAPAKNLDLNQHDLFANWYGPVICEMVRLKGFKADPAWIAKRLSPPITLSEAKMAIERLKQMGLLVENAAGKLVPDKAVLATGIDESSATLWQFQKNMLKLAETALHKPAKERNIAGVTMSVTAEQYKEIKGMINAFFAQLMDYVNESEEPGDCVCQINFQQFKLTE